MTSLETLSCNACGAPLEVPQQAKFIRCNHCGSQLAVRRSQTVAFTERLDQVEQRTEALNEEVQRLRLNTELQRLERDWDRERESYLVYRENKKPREPSEAAAVVGGVFSVTFGFFWTIMALRASGAAAMFGLLFIIFGLGFSVYGFQKAKDFRRAQRRYLERRRKVLREFYSPSQLAAEGSESPASLRKLV